MRGLKFARTAVVLSMAFFLISGGLAFAQSKENLGLPWDALIELSTGSVGAGIGFHWGKGTLTQAGKEYKLKVDGLSVGSVGVTKASALGKVYKLQDVKDINGTYTAVGVGATVGGGGAAITMQNAKGVIIDAVTTTEGLNFGIGPSGVTIKLED